MPKNVFKQVRHFSQAVEYVGKKLSKGQFGSKKIIVITIWTGAQEVSILCISFSFLSSTDQITFNLLSHSYV